MFERALDHVKRIFFRRNPKRTAVAVHSPGIKFSVFISYSSSDESLSIWLHKKLEGYRIPSRLEHSLKTRSLYPVFLDREELSSSSDLGEKLKNALRESYSLVVICSPEAAKSRWVNEEVRFFNSLDRSRRIFCVLAKGDPPGCFPDAVSQRRTNEFDSIEGIPLAADFRDLKLRGIKGFKNILPLRQQKLKLIAGLIGVSYGSLQARDKIRARNKLAVTAFLLILLSCIFGGSVYWQQLQYQERLKSSRVKEYIERGTQRILSHEPLKALPYLSAAYEEGEDGARARFLIARAMVPIDALKLSLPPRSRKILYGGFNVDGKTMLTIQEDGTGVIRDVLSGRVLLLIGAPGYEISTFSFSPDGKRIATASAEIGSVWNASSGQKLAELRGHSLNIKSLNFSPGGNLLVSASVDDSAAIWDGKSGNMLQRLVGHDATVAWAEFSPDGKNVLTVSNDKTARIWDAKTGHVVKIIKTDDLLQVGHFNSDGSLLMLWGRNRFVGLYKGTGEVMGVIPKGGTTIAAFFSPDARKLITVSALPDGHTLKVSKFPRAQDEEVHTLGGHNELVTVVIPDKSGQRIVTAGFDQSIKIWNSTMGKLEESFSMTPRGGIMSGVVSFAAFNSRSDKLMATTEDGELTIWDARATRKSISALFAKVQSIAYSPRGSHVVVTDNKVARVWRLSDDHLVAEIRPAGGILLARLSNSGKYLFTASSDGGAYVWSIPEGQLRYALQGHLQEVRAVAFNSSDSRLVTAGSDGSVIVWSLGEIETKILARVSVKGSRIMSVQFSPSGDHFLTSGYKVGAAVWGTEDGRHVCTLVDPDSSVDVVLASYSPDGSIVVTGGQKPSIWTPRGTLATELPRNVLGSVADFSKDGERFITVGFDEPVRIWSLSTGKLLGKLQGSRILPGSASFSPDGFRIMTSGVEGAQIWEASSGDLLFELEYVNVAVFNPMRNQIAAATIDGSVEIWDAHLEARSSKEIAMLVEKFVPWQLVNGSVSQARRRLPGK